MVAVGKGQKPMQTYNFQLVLIGERSNRLAPLGRDIPGVFLNGERSNLNPVISQLPGVAKRFVKRPAAKRFVAYRQFHVVKSPQACRLPVVAEFTRNRANAPMGLAY